jgi:hypothetical protein
VETLKRLIFMAIIPMIPDASVIFKHAAVITMALLYLQLYRWMQPFVEQHNNYLAELGCVQIILLALVSLLRQFADYRWTANSRQQMLLYDWIYVGVMCAQCVYLVVLLCGRYRQLMGYPLLAYQKLLYLIKYLVVSMICGYDLNAFDKDTDDYNDDEDDSDVELSRRNRISAEQLVSMRQSQLLLQHMDTQTKLLARLLQDDGEIRNESRRPPIPTASSKYRYDRYRQGGFGEHDDDDNDESMDCVDDDNAYGGSSRWHPRQSYDPSGPSPSRVRQSPSTRKGDNRVSSKSDRYDERDIEEHKFMGSHRFPSIRSQDRRVQQQESFRGGPRYQHGPSSRRIGSVKEHEDLHYHEDDEEMVLLASSRETEDLLYARDSDRRHQYPAADRELRESTNTVTHCLRNFRDENDNVSQDRYAELQRSPPQRQSGRMPRDQHIDRGVSTKMSPSSVSGSVPLPQEALKTAVKPNTVSADSGRARNDATTAVVRNSSEDNSPYCQKDVREPQAQHQYIVHAVSRKSSSRAAAPLSPERGLAQSSSSRGVSETIKSAPVGVKRGVAPSQVSTSSEAATTDPSYFDRSSRDSTRSTERLVVNEEVESLSKRSQKSGSSSSYASSQNSVYSTNPISGAVDGKPTKSLPPEKRLQSSQSLLRRSSDSISRDPVRGGLQLPDTPKNIPMLDEYNSEHPSDEQPLSDLDDNSYESSDYSVYSTPSLSKTERRGDGRNEERANIASVDQFSLVRTPQRVASNRSTSIETVQSAPVDVSLPQHGSKAAVEPRSAANSGQARKAAAASVAPKGPEVNSPYRQKDKTEPHTQHQYIVHAVSRKSSSRAVASASPDRGPTPSNGNREAPVEIKSSIAEIKRTAPSQAPTSPEAARTDPACFDRCRRDGVPFTERVTQSEETESVSKRSERSESSSSCASTDHSVYSTNPVSKDGEVIPAAKNAFEIRESITTKSFPPAKVLPSSQTLGGGSLEPMHLNGRQSPDSSKYIYGPAGGHGNVQTANEQPVSDLDDDPYESSDYSVYSTSSLSKLEHQSEKQKQEERANTAQKVVSNRSKNHMTSSAVRPVSLNRESYLSPIRVALKIAQTGNGNSGESLMQAQQADRLAACRTKSTQLARLSGKDPACSEYSTVNEHVDAKSTDASAVSTDSRGSRSSQNRKPAARTQSVGVRALEPLRPLSQSVSTEDSVSFSSPKQNLITPTSAAKVPSYVQGTHSGQTTAGSHEEINDWISATILTSGSTAADTTTAESAGSFSMPNVNTDSDIDNEDGDQLVLSHDMVFPHSTEQEEFMIESPSRRWSQASATKTTLYSETTNNSGGFMVSGASNSHPRNSESGNPSTSQFVFPSHRKVDELVGDQIQFPLMTPSVENTFIHEDESADDGDNLTVESAVDVTWLTEEHAAAAGVVCVDSWVSTSDTFNIDTDANVDDIDIRINRPVSGSVKSVKSRRLVSTL